MHFITQSFTSYLETYPYRLGHVKTASSFLLAVVKSTLLTHWTENSRSCRVLKIDVPLVIDVDKNKDKHVGKREVN